MDVSGDLAAAKAKRDAFRDSFLKFQEQSSSLLLLSLQWKGVEEHYAAVHDSVECKRRSLRSAEESLREILREVEAKRDEFSDVEALIEGRCRELDSAADELGEKFRSEIQEKVIVMGREFERRLEEIEEKDKAFHSRSATLLRLINERFEEAELKEKGVEAVSAVVRNRLRELKFKEERYEEKRREFELENLRFDIEQQKLNDKLREVSAEELLIKQRHGELDSKSKELEKQCRELQSCKSMFELDINVYNELSRDLKLKEKRLEAKLQELESSGRVLEVDRGKLDVRRREFESKKGELDDVVSEKMDEFGKCVAKAQMDIVSNGQFDAKMKFGSNMEKIALKLRELDVDRRELGDSAEIFKPMEPDKKSIFDSSMGNSGHMPKELELKEKQLEELEKEMVSIEKAIYERVDNSNIKERNFAEQSKQCDKCCEPLEHKKLDGCINVDGRNLQIFLNESTEELEKIHDKVSFLLKMCPDPAKVVLEAMQGFFPPHLKKGDLVFKGSVARQSCILLLEQLMKISPDIEDDLKYDATKLSFNWFTKLRPDNELSSHILGFLLLIATYRCHEAFPISDLIRYVNVVAHWRQVPELCKVLGFKDRIPDIIQDMLGKKHLLSAIKFISTFDLSNEHPPEPIFKEYMDTSRSAFKAIFDNESSSVEEKAKATITRIAELKAARRCILDHDLQSGYCPANINEVVIALEKQLNDKMKGATAVVNVTEVVELDSTRLVSQGMSSPVLLSSSVTANCSKTQGVAAIAASNLMLEKTNNRLHPQTTMSQQAAQSLVADSSCPVQLEEVQPEQLVGLPIHQEGEGSLDVGSTMPENAPEFRKCPVDLCVEIRRRLLKGDMEDEEGRENIVNKLTSSSNPAELVLDVVQGPHMLVKDKSFKVATKGTILLLKELRLLPHKLDQPLQTRAKTFICNYKRLVKHDHMGVILMLLFLDVFGVFIEAINITCLLDCSVWLKEVPKSLRQLELQDFATEFISKLIRRNERFNAVVYIQTMGLGSRFSVIAILKNHLAHQVKLAEDLLLGSNDSWHRKRASEIKLKAVKCVKKCLSVYCKDLDCSSIDIEEEMNKLEEPSRPTNLAGSKRKSSERGYEDQNASRNNSAVDTQTCLPKKMKAKYRKRFHTNEHHSCHKSYPKDKRRAL